MSSRPSILLVDDNAEILEILSLLLENEGYEVGTARDGAEALRRLHDGCHPGLIILDLSMPVMDGWAFRRAQMDDPALRDIPTIIYSASSTQRGLDALRVAGAFEKGGDFGALLSLVADLCGSARTPASTGTLRHR
ncbi:MAG: response regulator [Thermodesulfobacteriota bacterium]